MKPFDSLEDKFMKHVIILILFIGFNISALFAYLIMQLENAHKTEQVSRSCK